MIAWLRTNVNHDDLVFPRQSLAVSESNETAGRGSVTTSSRSKSFFLFLRSLPLTEDYPH